MNVSALSVFALCLALGSATKPDAPLVYHNSVKKGATTSAVKYCDEAAQDEAMANYVRAKGAQIDTACPPFNNPEEAKPLVLRNLKRKNMTAFLRYITQESQAIDMEKEIGTDKYRKAVGTFASNLQAADVQACHSDECLGVLMYLIEEMSDKIPQEALGALSGTQLRMLLKGIRSLLVPSASADAPKKLLASLDRIPESVHKKYAKLFLFVGDGILVARYSPTLVGHLLSDARNCALLTRTALGSILSDPKKQALLTEDCLAQAQSVVAGFEPGSDAAKLNKLPATALGKHRQGLQDKLIEALTADLVGGVAKSIPQLESPGSAFNIGALTKNNIKGLTQAVFLSALNHHGVSSPVPDAEAMKNLPVGILRDIKYTEDTFTALLNLPSNLIDRLPKSVFQDLVDMYPAVCARINASATRFEGISINNANCFRYMSGETQAAAFVTAQSLHSQALRHLSSEKFAKWAFTPKNKKALSNTAILETSTKSNRDALIRHLGEDPEGDDPCLLLGKNLSWFKDYKHVAGAISTKCFLAHPRSYKGLKPEEIAKLPKRLSFLMPGRELLQKDAAFFTGITAVEMGYLISGGAFCSTAGATLRARFDDSVWASMTGHCFSEMPDREKFTATQVAVFPADAFSDVPADRIPPELLKLMSPAQIEGACAKAASEQHNNLGALFTSDIIRDLSVQQLGAITADQWVKVPTEAFRGFISVSQLGAVSPAAMGGWTLDQVKEAPREIIAKISDLQAKEIGLKVPTGAEDPILYLANTDCSPEVLEILNSRLPEEKRITHGLAWWAWMLIILAVLAVAGGIAGAYFYMRP